MMAEPLNVLFLCTGNSARSILAEAVMNHFHSRDGRFRAFSAGSHPKGAVHHLALGLLTELRITTDGLRSKSWDEFSAPGAPRLDFVFTVCDSAASEVCPVWPGQPMTAHWGMADPAAATGTEDLRRKAFRETLLYLSRRIELFVNLPFENLSRLSLQRELDRISHAPSGIGR